MGDLPVGAELFDQAGQGVQGFPQGDDLRAAALPLDGVLVVAEPGPPHDGGQQRGLQEQGHRDHGRGHEDDHVAVRERLARAEGLRHGEGQRQRHRAAETRGCHHGPRTRSEAQPALAGAAVQ